MVVKYSLDISSIIDAMGKLYDIHACKSRQSLFLFKLFITGGVKYMIIFVVKICSHILFMVCFDYNYLLVLILASLDQC